MFANTYRLPNVLSASGSLTLRTNWPVCIPPLQFGLKRMLTDDVGRQLRLKYADGDLEPDSSEEYWNPPPRTTGLRLSDVTSNPTYPPDGTSASGPPRVNRSL